MANPIFARVELHEKPDERPDYEVLKQNMARWKFSHILHFNGERQILPTGIYARIEPCPIDLAKDMAELAADMTGFRNCGVVVSDEGFRTFSLKIASQRLPWLKASTMQPPKPQPALRSGRLYSSSR